MEFLRKRSVVVDAFSFLFGIGAWLAVNGIWVELPVLVDHLPEQWSLPSYITVTTQLANIGVILYGVLNRKWSNKINETAAIIVLMPIGIVASLLLVFFWDSTNYVGGELHSVGLLVLVFFVALVDCTSSVVFIPFMAIFAKTYLVSYFIGEGFSGFFPSIVALAQGVGGNPECVNTTFFNETSNETQYIIEQVTEEPRFSVEIFFIVLFALMCTSFIAFLILRFYPWDEQWYSAPPLVIKTNAPKSEPESDEMATGSYQTLTEGSSDYQSNHNLCEKNFNPKLDDMAIPLTLLTWINFLLNGVLLSIQSYSCLPYGNMAYHLTVTLSNAANPVGCFVAYFIPNHNKPMLAVITFLSTLIGVYILVLAILSPVPPLVDTTSGEALVVVAWVLVTGLLSHTKLSIATMMHEKGNRALYWYGNLTQIGSFIGAVVMFLLVNVYDLFKSYNPCV